ncbi:MAG: indolepyruvate oxidoreductase subunit beta [Candidatus Caldatribacterium sp.]|uniref:indolepyruvate oxidoreductase subunit beta n=1 Tax=Candidatus Caldatribacterium sp. TaxID=2282143 RepID=UPI00299ABDF8|nr:indolepyruvate oxidoreductase subunit beta [Candidatus Caldatribacterium sp.]MCX7730544.1 indolepyruvate oxidoreductase subunit beta [Candidatus Caldatribacterium sp.]MDW8081765.1 indolepyruvate oxidoreductase subunit beta [Candidatus Calescibacterium sp.]
MKGSMVLAGVGGMGILKASEVIAHLVVQEGLSVRQSEVHGMAQRGGSVVTHLRYGEETFSPLLFRGEADFMVAFEELEALRYISYLRRGGTVVLNRLVMCPPGVDLSRYPKNVPEILKSEGFVVLAVQATDIALSLGDIRVTNSVLLGALSRVFPIGSEESWEAAFAKAFQGKSLEHNLQAFWRGRR